MRQINVIITSVFIYSAVSCIQIHLQNIISRVLFSASSFVYINVCVCGGGGSERGISHYQNGPQTEALQLRQWNEKEEFEGTDRPHLG